MSLGNVDLTPQLVQAVRDSVDIADIASEQTRLTQKGNRWEGLCPLHKEKTPSFSVERDRGLFYCFGCGAGGDAIKLHMLLSGDDFPAAIESLALRYGVPMSAKRRRRRDDGPDVEGALAAAAEFFRRALARAPAARSYLEGRRIPPELVESFELGYAPDAWHDLEEALRGRVKLEALIAAGLVGRSKKSDEPYDRFRHRLVFPIRNASGRLVGFGGRTLGDDRAKYINTAETERFHKGSLLYGLFQARKAIRDSGRALLVEGYFDAIAAAAAGIDGAVASMGTALTPEQARLLTRYAEEVVVGYDGDSAGEKAHRRALPLLLTQGLAVYRASFGDGHDPDSLRLEAGESAVARAVDRAPDAVIAEIERLTPAELRREPQRQAKAAAAVADLLAAIPDGVLRFAYARRAAERLDVPVEVLRRRLTAAGRGRREPEPGDAPPKVAAEPAAGPIADVEENVLRTLLAGGAALPPAAELPSPEVFLDASLRALYEAFCAAYRDLDTPPGVAELLARDDVDDRAQSRLARLSLETAAGAATDLGSQLDLLVLRWHKREMRAIQRRIDEAQRSADGETLQTLLEERFELSQRRHRGTFGNPLDRTP